MSHEYPEFAAIDFVVSAFQNWFCGAYPAEYAPLAPLVRRSSKTGLANGHGVIGVPANDRFEDEEVELMLEAASTANGRERGASPPERLGNGRSPATRVEGAFASHSRGKGASAMRPWVVAMMTVLLASCVQAIDLPIADEQPQLVLPDYAAELRAFDYPDRHPISWHGFMVNAGYGTGRGGPGRRPGAFMDTNWILCDYLDRSGDYVSHEWLKHRGIPFEVYGYNEYQETIHFHEEQALPLFRDNGIARDYDNELVMSEHYNLTVESWAASQDFNAYIVCNNAPRWSSVINYDWLGSPLIGWAISQDNIGGPVSRIGAGNRGRYCDWCNLKFMRHLERHDLLPEFRARYDSIRDYVRDHIEDFPMIAGDLRWNEITHEGVMAITDDPVMAAYQKFQYISHAHNLMRYSLDNKLLAERLGIEFDCHGNQAGGFLGMNSYPLLISEFVDQAWFESAGLSQYDIFNYGWHNAHGAMRFVLGLASAPDKPVLCMTKLRKEEPDLVRHEYAESCAGGGVLFSQQVNFLERPDCQEVVREYWQFRHEHRALFSREGRSRHAQVALAYSIPTQMYAQYKGNVHAPHFNDVSGLGRAMFEGHIPFDALILHHPEMRADRWTAGDLSRYRLVMLPSVTCIADDQIAEFAEYLRNGGIIAVMGELGARDENNALREENALEHLREHGRVVTLLDGGHMHFNRETESDATRAVVEQAIGEIRKALGEETLLDGEIPRMLWVSTWRHQAQGADLLSAHFVNYQVDYESATATPTEPFEVAIRLPEAMEEPESATWLTTRGEPRELLFQYDDGVALVQVPSVEIYGVLVLGPARQERTISDRLQGDAMVQRAEWAVDGEFGDLGAGMQALVALRGEDDAAYREQAEQLLRDTQALADERSFDAWREMSATEGATLALDFGAEAAEAPWSPLSPEMDYSEERGYGWLPVTDSSAPTPEETGYGMAHRSGRGQAEMVAGNLPFWPYGWRPEAAIMNRNIYCGGPRTLAIDLPAGEYEVRVVRGNPSWTNRNFRCSGMVRDETGVRLFDTNFYPGGADLGAFIADVADGRLELTFGGPTGWCVSALVIRRVAESAGPIVAEREGGWLVSPRHPNPAWWPIRQVRFSREDDPTAVPATWTEVPHDTAGVLYLGSNAEADTGDVVYAARAIDSDRAREATLSLGATSAAVAWLNGEEIAYLPNVKGLREAECEVTVSLREGQNTLMLKLERHWERHWMFYAKLTD